MALPFPFQFYGRTHTSFFVNSNGSVTFGSGDRSALESPFSFFRGLPKIAPLWDDLNPPAGGGIFVADRLDRVVVTWNRVSEFRSREVNTYQAILFRNGTIRFNYDGVTIEGGLTGLSNGNQDTGQFVGFSESPVVTRLSALPILQWFSRTQMDAISIARRFYRSHQDEYDALVVFGSSHFFSKNLTGLGVPSDFYLSVRNDVRGIGRSVHDVTSTLGSAGRLQGFMNMNILSMYPEALADPVGLFPDTTLALLAHE